MREYQVASQARMQQMNHIQTQNDYIMRHWERTALANTPMPELKSIDLPQVPKPPKDPSTKRAEVAAALKAVAEAEADLCGLLMDTTQRCAKSKMSGCT